MLRFMRDRRWFAVGLIGALSVVAEGTQAEACHGRARRCGCQTYAPATCGAAPRQGMFGGWGGMQRRGYYPNYGMPGTPMMSGMGMPGMGGMPMMSGMGMPGTPAAGTMASGYGYPVYQGVQGVQGAQGLVPTTYTVPNTTEAVAPAVSSEVAPPPPSVTAPAAPSVTAPAQPSITAPAAPSVTAPTQPSVPNIPAPTIPSVPRVPGTNAPRS